MSCRLKKSVIAVLLILSAPAGVLAGEALPGATVQSLLGIAKANNPEYAGMRSEA